MEGPAVLEAAVLGPAQESGEDQGRWVINLMLHFFVQLNTYPMNNSSHLFFFVCLFLSFFFSVFTLDWEVWL